MSRPALASAHAGSSRQPCGYQATDLAVTSVSHLETDELARLCRGKAWIVASSMLRYSDPSTVAMNLVFGVELLLVGHGHGTSSSYLDF
jgi:hypothetical protein